MDREQLRGLLDRLEDVWREMDAPVASYLAPGLPDERMDELARRTGLALPEEARLLWGWRNGAPQPRDRARSVGPANIGARSFSFLPLEQAVWATLDSRDSVDRAIGPTDMDVEDFWAPQWMVVSQDIGSNLIVMDTAVPAGQVSPVTFAYVHDAPPERRPRLGSLTELIAVWVAVLERGGWVWRDGSWHEDPRVIAGLNPVQREFV